VHSATFSWLCMNLWIFFSLTLQLGFLMGKCISLPFFYTFAPMHRSCCWHLNTKLFFKESIHETQLIHIAVQSMTSVNNLARLHWLHMRAPFRILFILSMQIFYNIKLFLHNFVTTYLYVSVGIQPHSITEGRCRESMMIELSSNPVCAPLDQFYTNCVSNQICKMIWYFVI
jgi:hypothetical protein